MLISPAHAIAQALVLIRNIGCRLKLQGSRTSPNIALTLCYHSTKIILPPCTQGILLASAVYGCSTILKCKSTKIFSYLYIIRCIFKTILTEKRVFSCHGRTRTGTGTSPSTTPLSPQRGRGECLPWMRTGTETSPNPDPPVPPKGARGVPTGCFMPRTNTDVLLSRRRFRVSPCLSVA